MSHKVYITGTIIAREALEVLEENNCVFECGTPQDTPEDIARKLCLFKPDGLIVRQGRITEAVIDAARHLKVICKHGVGTDNIDINAATKHGIPVMNTPEANFESTAEHALALTLALARRIPMKDRQIRSGTFDKKHYNGLELKGKTIGLIGFGLIARRFCDFLKPFNANVLVYHPSCTAEPLEAHITKVHNPEEIYSTADIVSLHCPLTSDTANMINRAVFDRMKSSAFMINTARGGIVNETDLIHALRENHIAGAALDVFSVEPPSPDNPLLSVDNVIFTPHVGAISDNSFRNMGLHAVNNVLAVLTGAPFDPACVLNPAVIECLEGELRTC